MTTNRPTDEPWPITLPSGRRTIDILWDEFLGTCADNDEEVTVRGFAHWILQVW